MLKVYKESSKYIRRKLQHFGFVKTSQEKNHFQIKQPVIIFVKEVSDDGIIFPLGARKRNGLQLYARHFIYETKTVNNLERVIHAQKLSGYAPPYSLAELLGVPLRTIRLIQLAPCILKLKKSKENKNSKYYLSPLNHTPGVYTQKFKVTQKIKCDLDISVGDILTLEFLETCSVDKICSRNEFNSLFNEILVAFGEKGKFSDFF